MILVNPVSHFTCRYISHVIEAIYVWKKKKDTGCHSPRKEMRTIFKSTNSSAQGICLQNATSSRVYEIDTRWCPPVKLVYNPHSL